METKWLEDFVSLSETRSFSQPAFSRRIQALEAWAGVNLVDRSAYPMGLTDAGRTFLALAIEMLRTLQTSKAMLRGYATNSEGVVDFVAPHTLALTFFPGWIAGLQSTFGEVKSRLTAMNVHDAALRLLAGGCDFLVAYHHPSQPLQLDPNRFDMVVLGREVLAPFSKVNAKDKALDDLLAPDIVPTFEPSDFHQRGARLGKAGQRHNGKLALVKLENAGKRADTYLAGTDNFYVITRYNWSSYYAMAVIELGKAVARELPSKP